MVVSRAKTQLLKDKSQINIYPVRIIIIIGLRGSSERGGARAGGRMKGNSLLLLLLFDRKPQISVLPASERVLFAEPVDGG